MNIDNEIEAYVLVMAGKVEECNIAKIKKGMIYRFSVMGA